jgi:hypothetical protein
VIDVTSSFKWLGNQVVDAVLGDVNVRLNRTGQQWLSIVQAIAPVDTGALRAGLFYRVEGRTLTVGGTASHTIFSDRGTRNQPGQFFIERALNQVGSVLGAEIGIEFNVPYIVSPVLSHQDRMIVPSSIQPRPLTQAQHRRVQGNQAAMRRHYRGNVKRAKVRVRRIG